MKNYQIRVQDPSGETRSVLMNGKLTIGRGESFGIPLRDPTLPDEVALIWARDQSDSPYWVRVQSSSIPARLGDLPILETQFPLGIPLKLGETTLTIEKSESRKHLPIYPSALRPWLTESESGKKTLWMTKKASETPLSIYFAGETGTGKEVLAHLAHAWSDRASGPFVPLHCGALPLSLAESELFGHVKGAFTGAVQQRPGALMQAHNGTLFLDEIGDLPLDIQVKLLRFLENGEIRQVGADRPSRVDVRIICATHHPLPKLVEEGKFRRDLYYRLASVTVEIPTLRSRPEDIALLSRKFCADLGKTLSPRAVLRLQAYPWPGNVRELRHAVERACGLSGSLSPILGEEAFEFLVSRQSIEASPEIEFGAGVLTIAEMERVMLLKALKLARGNRANAAKILGVSRSTLFEMLKRYRIPGPRSTSVLVQD